MKYSIAFSFLMLLSSSLFSQESKKIIELGFTTRNLTDYGITFRRGTNNSLWRFNAISSNGQILINDNINNNQNTKNRDFGAGFQVGKERRTNISNRFELRHGADVGFNYNTSKYKTYNNNNLLNLDRSNTNYSPKINAVLGFNFIFNSFLLGAEIQPNIRYSFRTSKNYNSFSKTYTTDKSNFLSYGISTSDIRISFVYKFEKENKKK